MNIKAAKQEIIRTVRSYLAKDETGAYLIPRERQRPVLLMGAPGIGKTAVMHQIAEELGISLVSYTITHHTRQSAIGLPIVSERVYGGRKYSVTEYTMSEIVASIYDQIERSGIPEGILFLDEINCVSETLAPTMLQFLQYKTFGTHRVPDGYVIVTAGNPPEYNRSVRDFDIVTLDRLKRLDVTEDFGVWREYALRAGVHSAVLSYLEIRKERFYSVWAGISGSRFVTARGWEDLSDELKVYEKLGFPVTQEFVQSFLQDPETAEDFTAYYALFEKYRSLYRVPEILAGTVTKGSEQLKNAPFDEKLSLVGLLSGALGQEFRDWNQDLEVQQRVFAILKDLRALVQDGSVRSVRDWLKEAERTEQQEIEHRREARLLGREEERTGHLVCLRLREILEKLAAPAEETSVKQEYDAVRELFAASEKARAVRAAAAGQHLTNALSFLSNTFGEGQEIVLFLSEIDAGYYSLKFVRANGNEAYYHYNQLLLLRDRRAEIREEVMKLL